MVSVIYIMCCIILEHSHDASPLSVEVSQLGTALPEVEISRLRESFPSR